FQVLAQAVKDDITELEKHVQVVTDLLEKALTTVNELTRKENSEDLERVSALITLTAGNVRKELTAMDKQTDNLSGTGGLTVNERVQKQQYASLSKKFLAVMTNYNTTQTISKEKYRDQAKRQYLIVNPNATDEQIEEVLESLQSGGQVFARQTLSSEHIEAQVALEEIQSRHKDLMILEKSILELHALFVDLSFLIEQQGEQVDNVEYAVGQGKDHVEVAVVELEEAVVYKKKANKKMVFFYILMVAIIIGIVGGLAILQCT
ncbi:hypothetical protein SARC_05834, partial [Sphaeroforma arctica JP610]